MENFTFYGSAPPCDRAVCPVCGELRTLEPLKEAAHLLRVNGLRFLWHNADNLAWKAQRGLLHWACTLCLEASQVVKANPLGQTFCDFPPYLAYYDETLRCEACDQDFVFFATEQRFWYEELKFFVQSRPKHCVECRRQRREHNKLNQELEKAIRALDRRDVKQLAHVAELHLSMGNRRKSIEFLGRARNLARKQGDGELASRLDALQTQVKGART